MTRWREQVAPRRCGYDEATILRSFVGEANVLDFGCGYGRLTKTFDAESYLGYDRESELIEEASTKNPCYRFTDMLPTPDGYDTLVAYTVFLHMTDQEILNTLEALPLDEVIIVEILGHEWRRSTGFPPVYNRVLEEYDDLLVGYDRASRKRELHSYYARRKARPVYMEYLKYRKAI